MSTSPGWFLYMLRTPTGMLYTGITTDVTRRLGQHQAGKGAKALRGKGELELVFHCVAGDRSLASKLEIRVKKLSKAQKELLVKAAPVCLHRYFGLPDSGSLENEAREEN
ncbi:MULTISPECIES: GIY-YIG nuclease family protein [Rahnella]|uniref:GIY-YIG nuclease family protein n=1 Tax=Rahnella laticis TaxID=2787622 RepID=A0ABS0E3T8_9GAMM|nr:MULTISPECIES: GIY-YIG nuclease family protein [Rahnella]MBF7979506.1 GIY-YIG nuclease family protein [Rahnella laticis]MBF7999229.1 GIY-YIG nuclease family protein [Rahnella sp. LAC-M12]